ncbi:putative indolepyruvate decarboxylase family protein KNAG_0H01580 [Huiozyma naganishii CBS 8797]|uniref:2-hydroxyacyl-CoA lyase n=1 Tax=Huiozyma naganishii (strain ATCC MYA-139 / BCRC 22969 / CBS 8797 / KCTC 17520 / NBRC 10181 / NCYC 3082 / Yp74L-3) TaxID=1071383 RepID=J7S1Q5_HUIN7|nr:hypothetical protein KNAG_0H01580 [Kazachstania naganishii CBS 8797]CCK71572.1 hypothetical protein KNAG_0H01580 [Kazachstania naganishii CBS 8797]
MSVTITERITTVLRHYEVDLVFGIVGIPIVTLANEFITHGIRFVSCRNEQSASYAASAYGYLTGKPGVLLVVGGPGLIHSLAGVYNSINNRWPLIVLAGSNDHGHDQYRGAFQELDQISLLKPYVKFSGKLTEGNVDHVLFSAYNIALQGTKGVTYVDIPGNLIETQAVCAGTPGLLPPVPQPIKCSPDPHTVKRVASLILENRDKKVLVVVGKGSQGAFAAVRRFIDEFNFPFLPTPMGKGVVPDEHELNVSSARSYALAHAGIVLIMGARLNWILHYAGPPKWNPNAVFIQCDSNGETLGQNNQYHAGLSLFGDIEYTVEALSNELRSAGGGDYRYGGLSSSIQEKIHKNEQRLRDSEHAVPEESSPPHVLNYNRVYGIIRPLLEQDRTVLVTEGANTMDKARVSFPASTPFSRLDAGTNATMGVGLGYAMAAKLSSGAARDVVLIQGDSAFGFSGMELETLVRFQVGVVVMIMNNSGIYHGNGVGLSTKLSEQCRYDVMARGLGCRAHLVTTGEELTSRFTQALRDARANITTVLNVIIEHGSSTQVAFAWQNKPRM